jgi:hypothetical protein
MRQFNRLCVSALGLCLGFTSLLHGQAATLSGDLGGGTFVGTPISLPGSTFTLPFSQTAPAGTIVGDIIVTNDPTGTIFDMTITNLVYTCTAVNTAGFGDVMLVINHVYATAGVGPYTGSHALAGSWTSGPNSVVQLDSLHDVGLTNTPILPGLLATTSPFALGPFSVNVPATASANTYAIQATLRLRTDGLGAITLPSSAHINATLVPEPAGLSALLLGAGAITMRRRR